MQRRLPIFELVEEWHKSRSDNRSAEDLLGWLVQAFWAGQLKVYQPGSERTASRQAFLIGLREIAEGSGIVFYDNMPPERTTRTRRGAIIVDLRTQIVLPADASKSTVDLLNRAYAILAGAPVKHYPKRFLQAFGAHEIDRDEFDWLCDQRGWGRPSFWFGGRRKTASVVDPDCRSWLAAESQGPRQQPKAYYAAIARDRFGTPLRRFNQIWAEVVPASWHRPGRLPSKSER